MFLPHHGKDTPHPEERCAAARLEGRTALGVASRMTARTVGWDVGGAHLKLAVLEDGLPVSARQLGCPLWRGLDELREALSAALRDLPAAEHHAVTMTGELVDFFPDRASGVAAILDVLVERVPARDMRVYGTSGEFLGVAEARAHPERVASANWHATAQLVGRIVGDALLVDIGSTTTDILPIRGGRVAACGVSDAERLASGELVYTGIARTPLAAVARTMPFAGRAVGVMAEFFATMADAHRLAGTLPDGADLHPAADGRGKTAAESRARLARMIGRDEASASAEAWRQLAHAFIRRQIRQLEDGAELVLSRSDLPRRAALVGAGAGTFLAVELARRLDRPYRSFADILGLADRALADAASTIAPALAVAMLLSPAPS